MTWGVQLTFIITVCRLLHYISFLLCVANNKCLNLRLLILKFLKKGVYSSWSEWSKCSSSCKRGVRVREKTCNRNISDSKSLNSLCLKSLYEESKCLNLEKCNASGYYLANYLQSCNQFCRSKGN